MFDAKTEDCRNSTVSDALVSVVVPCYNAEAYLLTTLGSVLSQTHRDLELIVVDDASTDSSAEVVERLTLQDPRVRLVRMPRNAGAPAAPRNLGTRAASGEWIAYLDADDIWHPRKLELQMQVLRDHGGTMCSTRMSDFRDEREVRFATLTVPMVSRVDVGMQLRKYRTPTSSILIRRELMLALPFNEDLILKAREDTDAFIRVHEYLPYSLKIEHPLVFYRLQAAQISGNKLKMVKRHLMMLRRYRQRSGQGLGWKAYYYTATHFLASIYLRLIRGTL
jgi:teichuronic acid biosynthesis glycosyltransferase TuaG